MQSGLPACVPEHMNTEARLGLTRQEVIRKEELRPVQEFQKVGRHGWAMKKGWWHQQAGGRRREPEHGLIRCEDHGLET